MMNQFQRECSLPGTGVLGGYLKLDEINPGLGVSKMCVSWLEISPVSSHTHWIIGKRDDFGYSLLEPYFTTESLLCLLLFLPDAEFGCLFLKSLLILQ